MNFVKQITDISKESEFHNLTYSEFTTKIVALYVYYHYFNADVSRLDEIWDTMVNTDKNDSYIIKSILKSDITEGAIDFNSCLKEEDYKKSSVSEVCSKIRNIASTVGSIVYHDSSKADEELISKYDDLQIKLNENTSFIIRVICPFSVPVDKKIEIQQKVSELSVPNQNVMFEIIFGDDIEEEISDIESPKEYVANATINLINDSICYFGEEKSFITLISAKSVKKLFLQYGTRGLFASNLRFYITSKKIDGKIISTIQNEPENFCYFNNGMIITCDDCKIVNGVAYLTNFSVVNGGQTTNIIGRTKFENDFGIPCKFIINKYSNKNKKVEFLSKVAEASNMQKPINAKDLIANKPEQRLLKIQFADAGMFLKVKRGEKIDKTVYPEPYMNASNDEVAQLIYSYVFQSPGASKNSKSGVIGNDKSYNLIFKNQYDSNFLKSIQIMKVAYGDWQKKLIRTEPRSTPKFGLSRHANYYTGAVISFFLKVIVNSEIRDKILKMKNISDKNFELKSLLRINDIGKISLIKPSKFDEITKTCLFDLFEFVFEKVLLPAYRDFRRKYPMYAFAHFCKSDAHYYNFVLVRAKMLISDRKSAAELENYLSYFNTSSSSDVKPTDKPEDFSAESLEEELKRFRKSIYDKSGKSIKATDVFRNSSLSYIVKLFPTDRDTLIQKCFLTPEQCDLYANDIIDIVKKYIRSEDFS